MVSGFHFVQHDEKSNPQRDAFGKKNKLLPAHDFLFGLRITATSAGKSVHILPGPHFFQACALILIPSGF